MKMKAFEKHDFLSGIDLASIDVFSILDNFYEGVIITDAEGIIMYFNEVQAQIDDFDPRDVIGKEIAGLYRVYDELSPTMRCLKTRKPIENLACFYRTHQGKVVNSIHNIFPLFADGRLIGAICFVRDYPIIEQTFESVLKSSKKNLAPTPGHGFATSKESRQNNGTRFTFADIIGDDPEFLRAVEAARLSAESPSPVMLFGETGVGKELLAQSIHNHSKRNRQQYVAINCAAIPENLLEGILFGTSKGAFTGAVEKAGLFEHAHGGTIFLDEINSMPISLQAKLLRVLQERKVRRIGSLKEIEIDVKIISSVNTDPHQAVGDGALRPDLLYRLGVVFIRIAPLRERLGDLEKLSSRFLDKCNVALGKNVTAISSSVLELFRNYSWPGNVRELEYVIEGAMNMVRDEKTIDVRHLSVHIGKMLTALGQFPDVSERPSVPFRGTFSHRRERAQMNSGSPAAFAPPPEPEKSLAEIQTENEIQSIRQALMASNGNAAKAARSLGISPQLLNYKMKKYHISRKEFTV